MQKLIQFILILVLPSIATAQTSKSFFDDANRFFSAYVDGAGAVDYDAILNKKAELSKLVGQIGNASLKSMKGEEKKTFLINAYNVLVIEGVISNYPINSPQAVEGFYDKVKYKVGGQQWTLNYLENEQIRPVYNDPRVHFVLNCGAISCPPLINRAYMPETLDAQMEVQTVRALNDNKFIRTSAEKEKNYLSEIFKWYAKDFNVDGGDAIDYINKYREEKLDPNYKTVFYPYNWNLLKAGPINVGPAKSNVQVYTPSALLKKGQIDILLFNNVYTQTAFRNDKRELIELDQRSTFYGGIINFLAGVSKNGSLNAGFDINIKGVHNDSTNTSPLRVFSLDNNANHRFTIGSIGPKIKFSPFKKARISVQSAFWIPIASDLEADERGINGEAIRPWTDYNRYTWWNQIFFDKPIGTKFQLFTELDFLFRFAKNRESYVGSVPKNTVLSTPASFFVNYFPTLKSTIYGMVQYAPSYNLNRISFDSEQNDFISESDVHFSSDFAQFGIGGKYQINERFNIELLYSNFFLSQNGGAGETFNLGIRYIH